MSIADTIESMRQHTKEAYDAIQEKGGTVRGEMNLDNLADSIQTITGGGGGYTPPYDIPEFDGGEWGAVAYLGNDGTVKYRTLTSNSDLNAVLTGSGETAAVKVGDDEYITKQNLLAYSMGTKESRFNNSYFLYYCINLQNLYGLERYTGETIQSYSLANCYSFNQPLVLPPTITRITSHFMENCFNFNSPITLPEGLTSIGDQFMQQCYSFNAPINLPKTLTSTGTNFLYSCYDFNQPIEIPEGMTSINHSFLEYCKGFNSPITLHSSLQTIGNYFMRGTNSFNQPMTIPESVTSIGQYFMSNTLSLQEPITVNTPAVPQESYSLTAYVSAANTTIMAIAGTLLRGPYAQAWKDALPDTNTSMKFRKIIVANTPYAVLYTPGVEKQLEIYDENLVREAVSGRSSSSAFQNLSNYTNLKFTEACQKFTDITSIGGVSGYGDLAKNIEAVEGLSNFTNVTSIGSSFLGGTYSSKKLKRLVDLPPNLQTIGANFLAQNADLESIPKIPNTVTSIGNGFLYRCTNFNGPVELSDHLETIGNTFLYDCNFFNQPITLPNSVTAIGQEFMEHCHAFNSPLVLSNALTIIPDRFLSGFSTSPTGVMSFNQPLEIPDSVTTIDTYFLAHLRSFNQPLTIPKNVSVVNGYFMRNCDNFVGPLTVETSAKPTNTQYSLTVDSSDLPAYETGVTLTGSGAQVWKDAMPDTGSGTIWRKLIVQEEPASEWGVLTYTSDGGTKTIQLQSESDFNALSAHYSFDAEKPISIQGESIPRENITKFVFGTECTTINDKYFLANCISLTEIENIEVVESFNEYFLSGCTSFNQPISLSQSLTTIGRNFLDSCTSFNQPIEFPDSLQTIGKYFLYSCTSFNQPIELPSSLQTIEEAFLFGCSAFDQPLKFPDSMTGITKQALENCTSFNSKLTLPANCTTIGDWFLYGCSAFNQPLELPNGLQTIGERFMMGCSGFTQPISLPNTLTAVRGYFMGAMVNFTGPVNIGSLAATVFTTSSWTLYGTGRDVPAVTQGITIVGDSVQDFLARFPDQLGTSPYRKLVAGS